MMTARLPGWTEDEYHSDPCEVPSLSASIAHTLISRSPLHAWTQHPRLGGVRKLPTKEMDKGSLIHHLILGGGRLEIIEADSFRTKAAREARDAAIVAGKTAVLAHKLEEAKGTAEQILERCAQQGIVLDGHSEQAMTWTEPSAEGAVRCRGMMDHVALDRGVIYDLKTTQVGHPDAVASSAYRYGYDIQAAAYISGLSKVQPDLAGRVDFVWLFVETEPPFAVTPLRPTGMMVELGERRWQRAVESWAWCMQQDEWPGYVDGIGYLDAPGWALAKEEGEAA